MTVDIIGGGKREDTCRDLLLGSELSSGVEHAVILPIPSSRNGKTVTGTDEPLDAMIENLKPKTLVVGYALPETVIRRLEERGAVVVDVSEDEEFAEENAKLTAECTLSHIMTHSERSLSDLRIGIVGYGRIGRELSRMLLFLGSHVSVFTRKESTRLELIFSGVDAVLVGEADLFSLDLLVNTAPASVFTRSQYENAGCEVLELASGNNLPYAKNLTRLPSLPAKMLPQSSGRLYAEAIFRALGKRRM